MAEYMHLPLRDTKAEIIDKHQWGRYECIKITKTRDGIFFTQDGERYNLYNLPAGLVIRGNLNLSNIGLTQLPDMSKCTIEGRFDCSFNPLTSLAGCPRMVREFVCEYTDIRDLRGAPKLAESVYVRHNRLKSLVGAPHTYYDDEDFWREYPDEPRYLDWPFMEFNCSDNELTTLSGLPAGWDFIVCDNNNIKSLSALQPHPLVDSRLFHPCISCANNSLVRLDIDTRFSDVTVRGFNGNPCTKKYAEWFLQKRGLIKNPTALDIAAMVELMSDPDFMADGFMDMDELRIANRELFNNKKTFARGATVIKARTKMATTQKQITVAKDDKVH
ncbi:MAG: hypothetical protein IJX89_01440 [Alphaproteobacteria bacterium]|nr:hypothetical protein [Alphaproteobacteria bacterium]